jgi:prepilin-type N-terminal cleavage/methylation domain-containing protein
VHKTQGDRRNSPDGRQHESGFTLIEIMIVTIVLGILAVVVLLALAGMTGKSARAACQEDGATISSAISDLNNSFPNVFASVAATNTASAENLLLGNAYSGPYISSWPNNSPHYAFSLNSSGVLLVAIGTAGTLGAPFTYAGPSSCPSIMN